jgi:DNA invertase Pin-like site-specific DNA recombinase
MKAALYIRVSTTNQDPDTQRLALRDYCQARGIAETIEYADIGISGTKDRRPALDQLVKDAKIGRFDRVIVTRFDRFARSTKHLVTALEEFQSLGIDFISLGESIDTSTPMGKMVFTILGAVAELERDIIRERVILGIDRAKKQGKPLGRPKRIVDRQRIAEMRAAGETTRTIAKALGIAQSTVVRRV